MRTLPTVAAEADSSRSTSTAPALGRRLVAPLQHRCRPSCPVIRQHPKEPVRQLVADAMGTDSIMGTRSVCCRQDDQRTLGDSSHEARVSRPTEISQVPDPCRWLLRVVAGRENQAAVLFEVNNGELFAFAGLWDRWKDPSGRWVKSCSILTTTPNSVTSAVHDRMPVILDPDSYDLWLDPGMTDVAGRLGTAEALRCSFDAELSGQQSSQPCGER